MNRWTGRAVSAVAFVVALAALAVLGTPAAQAQATCTCNVYVSSTDRWMDPYWALECNNHGGHGVCSNNVDSAHGSGCGAMNGSVTLWFGGHQKKRNCPDDHWTCFHGPSYCDSGGAWGNVCNCDTEHSQSWDPGGEWWAGSLTDSATVSQLTAINLGTYGACGAPVTVRENIQEHDPWCCDDNMGDLWVQAPTGVGWTHSQIPVSAQNCNGGSQSGLPCGRFGATINVSAYCTQYTPPDDSCWGFCGGSPGACACDFDCMYRGDCCGDYCSACNCGIILP
jgi:hypothetical protein